MKQTFKQGDFVSTVLGNGYIYDIVNPGEHNEHILFHPNAEAQKEFNLENKPYTMNYSEIKNHLIEGHNNRTNITGERKKHRRSRNGQSTSDRKQKQMNETMTFKDFLNEGVDISQYELLPTMIKAMKELQKELSDYKKVGDSGKIAEITADIQDLNNKIVRKKQGKA